MTYLVQATELEVRELFSSSIVCEWGVPALKVIGTNSVMTWNNLLWMSAELLYASRNAFCTSGFFQPGHSCDGIKLEKDVTVA